jgi:shikimate 5-dehydrogenase
VSTINKDTKLYGSFSENPGNNGCMFFNKAFEKYGIDAIYKSFYSNNIKDTIQAVKHLNFSGFALSMPHKVTVIPYLNELSDAAHTIGAVNTVLNENGKLIGHNTDFTGVCTFFDYHPIGEKVFILGNGGFSRAIRHACGIKGIQYEILERKDVYKIEDLHNETIINATPAEVISHQNKVIDLRPHTHYGKVVAEFQAMDQFKLYTKYDYEYED